MTVLSRKRETEFGLQVRVHTEAPRWGNQRGAINFWAEVLRLRSRALAPLRISPAGSRFASLRSARSRPQDGSTYRSVGTAWPLAGMTRERPSILVVRRLDSKVRVPDIASGWQRQLEAINIFRLSASSGRAAW